MTTATPDKLTGLGGVDLGHQYFGMDYAGHAPAGPAPALQTDPGFMSWFETNWDDMFESAPEVAREAAFDTEDDYLGINVAFGIRNQKAKLLGNVVQVGYEQTAGDPTVDITLRTSIFDTLTFDVDDVFDNIVIVNLMHNKPLVAFKNVSVMGRGSEFVTADIVIEEDFRLVGQFFPRSQHDTLMYLVEECWAAQ